jgi:TrmH RNA methyltransferase
MPEKRDHHATVREIYISGWNACLALFERRPQAIRKIYVVREKTKILGEVLKWAASQHIAYKVVDAEDCAKIAKTTRNEGVVFVAEEKAVHPGGGFAEGVDGAERGVLILDSVSNPHNLGAIFRTCAFFEIASVLLTGKHSPHRISPAVMRVAQGGVEHVRIAREEKPAHCLQALKEQGFTLIGTDVFGKDIEEYSIGEKRCALVMGSEGTGMQPEVRDMCDSLVKIAGSGRVESLNVSVACGIFLALLR